MGQLSSGRNPGSVKCRKCRWRMRVKCVSVVISAQRAETQDSWYVYSVLLLCTG